MGRLIYSLCGLIFFSHLVIISKHRNMADRISLYNIPAPYASVCEIQHGRHILYGVWCNLYIYEYNISFYDYFRATRICLQEKINRAWRRLKEETVHTRFLLLGNKNLPTLSGILCCRCVFLSLNGGIFTKGSSSRSVTVSLF